MEKQKMLIVDDSQLARTILKDIFDDEYLVLEASNGTKALEILEQRAFEISVMLLDMIMPEMDGLEVLKRMRRDEKMSQIPVIVTTSDPDLEMRALEFGVIDYIVKPYNEVIIKHRIDNVMAKIFLEKQKAEVVFLEEIRFAAEHDELTGLYNKRKFLVVTKDLLERNPDIDFAIIRWNIDRFRTLHSLYGDEVATKLLKEMADFFLKNMQIPSTYARLEDDNFVCCVRQDEQLYGRLLTRATKALEKLEIGCLITLSLGIYEITDRQIPIDKMCDFADVPIEAIRDKYISQFAYYNEQAIQERFMEQEILLQMEQAIAEEQFVIYYQPVVSLSDQKTVSAEALVRWMHPERGITSPGVFIPIFEKNGFITKLDYYVWDKVCRYQKERMDQGLELIPISVNISRRSIYDLDISYRLSSLIHKYGIPSDCLRLEITESAYMDNGDLLVSTVKDLKSMGFVVMMDDFGSGYSSLNTLKDLPVDILKIDMKFMEHFENSSRAGNILTSVVRLAKWIGMPVIAEGVETQAQLDFLKSIGCDKIQGYYYSKPLPPEEFEAFLKTKVSGDAIDTVFDIDTASFDSLFSGDFLITKLFNGVVGGIAIYEYSHSNVDLVRVNDGYYDIYGYTASTFNDEGYSVLSNVFEKDVDAFLDCFDRCCETKQQQSLVFRRYHADGRILWIDMKLQYLGNTNNRPLLCAAFNDVTQIKKMEIHDQVRKFTSTLMALCDEMMEFNLDNDSFQVIYSKFAGEHVEFPVYKVAEGIEVWLNIVVEEDRDYVRELMSEEKLMNIDFKPEEDVSVQCRIFDRYGNLNWCKLVFLRIDEGHFLGCIQNITVQKQAEILVQEQLISAQNQLNRMMNGFQKTNRKILIIDDEPVNRMILRKYMEDQYMILEAKNGEEALTILSDQVEPVSVILLDLIMPIMDGYQFLKKIKADPSLMSVPVIVISGSNDAKAESEVLKLGAMDLLKKPFSREVIIQRVNNIVQLCEVIANMSVNQSLINDMPCAMAVLAVGEKIRITFASEWLAREYFQGTISDFLNLYEHNAMAMIYEEDREWLENKIKNAAKNQEPLEEEIRIHTGENYVWAVIRARYVYSENEEAFYYVTIIDIEAQKKCEAMLNWGGFSKR